MELIDKAMKTDKELGMFVYIAPFLRQAKAIAWARLKQKIEPLRRTSVIDINEGELSVRFKHNGAIIRLFGGDNLTWSCWYILLAASSVSANAIN